MYPWMLEEWFGKEISSYYTMWVVAAILSALYFVLFYKKFKLNLGSAVYLFLFALVFGILGASVFSFLFRIGEVFSGESTVVELLFGSYMYYGGFLGGVIGLILYSVKEKKNFFRIADFAVMVLPLAHAAGRLGCYFVGCCYGYPSESHGVIFGTHALWGLDTAGVKVLPVMLYESMFNAILFVVLITIYFTFYWKKFDKNIGLLGGVYCIAYSVFRFIIEFLRYDDRGSILGLSTAQFISIFVFLGGVYLFIRLIALKKGSRLSEMQRKILFADIPAFENEEKKQ